jgi:hypothetical protein
MGEELRGNSEHPYYYSKKSKEREIELPPCPKSIRP